MLLEALQFGSDSERGDDAATARGGQGSSFPDMQTMFSLVTFLGRADGEYTTAPCMRQ